MAVLDQHVAILGEIRLEIEIAEQDEIVRMRQFGETELAKPGDRHARMRRREGDILQRRDLAQAFFRVDVIEMDGIKTDRTRRRVDQRLQRATLKIELRQAQRSWQQVSARRKGPASGTRFMLPNWNRLCTAFAVLDPAAEIDIGRHVMHGETVGQQRLDLGDHVASPRCA